MNERCRNCQHWEPLFSGEHWGVRSFADAPESERELILRELAAADSFGFPKDHYPGMHHPSPGSSLRGVWPMWGKCKITDLDYDGNTLARAQDGSGYTAVLQCHADFGCVQWKEYIR